MRSDLMADGCSVIIFCSGLVYNSITYRIMKAVSEQLQSSTSDGFRYRYPSVAVAVLFPAELLNYNPLIRDGYASLMAA